MRALAGLLGIVGALGTAYVGATCRTAGAAEFDHSEALAPMLADVRRVGWLLLASACAALVLNVALLASSLPRRVNSLLIGFGLAAIVWLGCVLAIILNRVA
jgi:hypothetical protein